MCETISADNIAFLSCEHEQSKRQINEYQVEMKKDNGSRVFETWLCLWKSA